MAKKRDTLAAILGKVLIAILLAVILFAFITRRLMPRFPRHLPNVHQANK